MMIKRGDIVLVRFNPVLKKEVGKTRPAIVISNDVINQYSETLIIIPLTSVEPENVSPLEISIFVQGGLKKPSKALIAHIRALHRKRILKRFGEVDEATLNRLIQGVGIAIGMY